MLRRQAYVTESDYIYHIVSIYQHQVNPYHIFDIIMITQK